MSQLYDAATEALAALRRVRPQIRGVLPEQDCDNAIRALEEALKDERITAYYHGQRQNWQPPPMPR